MTGKTGHGFSVRIHIPSGDPDGLKVVEKSNWTGRGLVFPRPLFDETKKQKDLNRAGVYVLWGPGSTDVIPRAYVGEGDPVLPRLEDHAKNRDFWTHAAVFVSKDDNLNKALVQHIEARLISLAGKAKRCDLQNLQSPLLPSLSEPDQDDAEAFLMDMLLCFPLLGVSFFEEANANADTSSPLLHCKGKGVTATGRDSAQGFIVLQGSTAVAFKNEAPAIPKKAAALRRQLLEMGVVQNGTAGVLTFTQNYVFTSPSAASDFLLGASTNGLGEWKDDSGRTLGEIRKS